VPEQSVNSIVRTIQSAVADYPAALQRESSERVAAEKPVTVLEPITIAQCDGTACAFSVATSTQDGITCPAAIKFDGYELAVESASDCTSPRLLGMNSLVLSDNSARGPEWLQLRSASGSFDFSIQDEAARANFRSAFEEGKGFIATEMGKFQTFLQVAQQDQRAAEVLRKIQQAPARTEEGRARRWAELVEETEQK